MKTIALITILISVLSAACAAQTQDLKFFKVSLTPDGSTPSTIHFYCSKDYDKSECVKEAIALRKALAPYPLQLEGEWSYYLVMAEDWKPLVRLQGGDPRSPASSLLLGRATVLDRSLFFATAKHNKELLIWSGIAPGPILVDVAVTHELGHAICQEKNEAKANDYGRALREGKTPECGKTASRKATTVAQDPR